MQISSRGMRRASLALALGVTGAAALAPAAFATTRVNFTNTPDGASVDVSDNVPAGSVSATLRRNGSPLASNTGFGGAWGNFVGIELPNKGTLSPGDDVQLIKDGAVVNTVTYDGKPTVNADACTGAKTITGTAAGTTSFFAVTAFTPGGGSGSSDNPATLTRSGEGYTAKFGKPLAKGDKLYVSQAVDNGDLQVSALNIKDIGDCPAPAPVAKPAAVPAAPTATQILAGL